jgi:hypothetical protein
VDEAEWSAPRRQPVSWHQFDRRQVPAENENTRKKDEKQIELKHVMCKKF